LVQHCRKRRRICPASQLHRIPAADMDIVFFVVVVGSDGRRRWRTHMLGNRGQKSGWWKKCDPY